jgi:Saxitoxin biosynthesis operon protein SxtJ
LTDSSNPPRPRRTTLTVMAVFAGLALLQLYRAHTTAAAVFGLVAAGLVGCSWNRVASAWFHRNWMALATALGAVNSRILLSVFYCMVISPVGRIARLVGYDPLTRRKPAQSSYWITLAPQPSRRESFERSY